MKTALIDASSAILLHKARLFNEIASVYRLSVVPTVYREITVEDHEGAGVFQSARQAGRIHVVPTNTLADAGELLPSLHAGESETIKAYGEHGTHFIIMDDGRGARACRAKKIPYINALLCPNILYLSGKIDGPTYRSTFRRLRDIGRYGDEVIAYAQNTTRQNLAAFFP